MEYIDNENYKYGAPKLVGGLFPDAVLDEEFFDGLELAKTAPELSGLYSRGFSHANGLDLDSFNMAKVAEIYELSLNYYVKTLDVDPTASVRNIQTLTQLLLAVPESNNSTGVSEGDLILALWLAGFEFDRSDDYKGGAAFYMNYESGMDAESYHWSPEGFNHIMNLISGFKRDFLFDN